MGFYKKTILLSNQSNYQKGMAILTIEQNNSGVFGCIKMFDIPRSNNLVLGISVDGKPAIKQSVPLINSNVFNFKLANDFEINSKIGCVLADINGMDVKVIVWGTNGSQAEYKNDIIDVFKKDISNKNTTMQSAKTHCNEASSEACCSNEEKSRCAEQSKGASLSSDLFESDEKEIEKIIDENMNDDNFFELIGEQIGELFDKFPIDEELNNLVPNSKWVRVDYDNDNRGYVLGLIYENNEIRYICYGVPSRFDVLPPPELQPYSQWLELDENEGFWVMYQDARTGDSLIIDEVKNL